MDRRWERLGQRRPTRGYTTVLSSQFPPSGLAPDYNEGESDDASLVEFSFDKEGVASSLLGNESPQLSRPRPHLPATSHHLVVRDTSLQSAGPGNSLHGDESAFEYGPQSDQRLRPQGGIQESPQGCQMAATSDKLVVRPFQPRTSTEPEQLPWSGLHLVGMPSAQSAIDQLTNNFSMDHHAASSSRPTSTLTSFVNPTDDGYASLSHPEHYSTCSADSAQMPPLETGYSSTPGMMARVSTQAGATTSPNNTSQNINFQIPETMQNRCSRRSQSKPLVCPTSGCTFICKTMSDLRKHKARHDRKFVCDLPNCTRSGNGFPTTNDLQRHQRCVHDVQLSSGRSQVSKCFSTHCKQPGREFRRFDNFKQHVLRVHSNEDTQELIQQSKDWQESERGHIPFPSLLGPEVRPHGLRSRKHLSPSTSRTPFASQPSILLSPTWQKSSDSLHQRQVENLSEPRRRSLTTRSNICPRNSPPAIPSFAPALSDSPGAVENTRLDRNQKLTDQMQRSTKSGLDLCFSQSRGRPTPAFTAPNPDSSALSELPDTDFTSSGDLIPAQSDLAQIAAGFSGSYRHDFDGPEQDFLPSSFSIASRTSSQPYAEILDRIETLTDSDNDIESNNNSTATPNQGMQESGRELEQCQQLSVSATTTISSTRSAVASTRTLNTEHSDSHPSYVCSQSGCPKSFHQKSLLRKHRKRHDKPYGCTYPGCFDKFGSKYDWRRHENSLHFQQECWKCDLCLREQREKETKPTSAQLFYKRHIFVQHLEAVHSLPAEDILEHTRTQRIGRNCQTTFWCGFCVGILVLQGRGLDGVEERFNHIGEHFNEGGKISTWIDPGRNLPKGASKSDQVNGGEESEEAETLLDQDCVTVSEKGDKTYHTTSHLPPHRDRNTTHHGSKMRSHNGEPGEVFTLTAPGPARKRARTNEDGFHGSQQEPPSRSSTRNHFVYCCDCGNGPAIFELTSQCVSCNHIWCQSCRYSLVKESDY